MMQAWAADATHGTEAFYVTAEFWVLVAFVIFVAGAMRPALRTVTAALDRRSQRIKDQIEEARTLREDAQELLASFQRKQADAEREAEELIANARAETERMSTRASEDLELAVERRQRQAEDRIAQAEAKALADVRRMAVDVALDATRRVLAEKVTGDKADALIDDAIKDLPDKLH